MALDTVVPEGALAAVKVLANRHGHLLSGCLLLVLLAVRSNVQQNMLLVTFIPKGTVTSLANRKTEVLILFNFIK